MIPGRYNIEAKRAAIVLLLLAGCASLPPTTLPVCDGTFEIVCRAPAETFRSYEWEAYNACPRLQPVPNHPELGACYVHAGARDSRQVYLLRAFPR